MGFISGFKKLRSYLSIGKSTANSNSLSEPSSDLANKLVSDRVQFKIYAAKHDLDNLKKLEDRGSTMASASNVPRVIWEIKMECLLAHLIGSVDSLLVRINDTLGLGMNIKDVNSSPSSISEIKKQLNKRAGGESNLLDSLDLALDSGDDSSYAPKDPGWLRTSLRNQGLHRNLIPKHVSVHLHEDVNTGKGWSDKTRYYATALEV